jgi:hypothetical protein
MDKQEHSNMAGEKNLPDKAAEDTIFSNLGLTREELGVTDDDEGSGHEDLDAGSGHEGGGDGSGHEGDDDSSRVTHTSPFPSRAEVKPDGRGNLVGADGKIIARAGKEARLYQDLHKTRGQAQTLQGQLSDVTGRLRKAVEIGQNLHRELEQSRAAAGAIKEFGLDQSEHLTALRLFKELRDNPKEALKNILTRAATNGINITELGLQGGVDPKSLVDMIRQEISKEMTPLKERSEADKRTALATHQERERLGQLQREVDTFFSENQEAREYLPVFTETLKQFPGMSLGEIWARIQLHFALNPADNRRKSPNSLRRSLPQGRGAPANGGGSSDIAPVTDSYDAIVKDALTKAGFTR